MRKLFYSLAAFALMATTACQESAMNSDVEAGNIAQLTINAKALIDNAATRAENAPELVYYLEVYSNGKLYEDLGESSTGNFSASLVTGLDYTLVAWADYDQGYYDARGTEGVANLDNVNLVAENYAINNDLRDAFAGTKEVEDFQGTEAIPMTLTRPFARINVATTDYTDIQNPAFLPTHVTITYDTPIYTSYNVITGAVNEDTEATTTPVTAMVDADGNLSFDYLFASKETSYTADFTADFSNGVEGADFVTDYKFTNIPYKQNFKTNVSGRLFTKQGNINVDVNDDWAGEECIGDFKFSSLEEYNNFVTTKDILGNPTFTISSIGNGMSWIIEVPSDCKAESITIKVLEVGVETYVTVGNNSTYAGDVNLEFPTAQQTTYVNALLPEAHVTFLGDAVNANSSTSRDTFVVLAGASVGNLFVQKGNVEINGSVAAISRNIDNTDAKTFVKLGEGVTAPTTVGEKVILYNEGDVLITNLNSGVQNISLATAIAEAEANDVLSLSAGVTKEKVSVDKPLTIQGPNAGIAGYSTERVAEVNMASGAINVKSDNVTIDGISFQGGSNSYQISHTGNISNLTLKNLYVCEHPYVFFRNTEETGDVTNLVVEDCKFEGFHHATFSFVFFLYNLKSAIFEGNMFDDITRHSLNLNLSPEATSLDIKNNTFVNHGECAIQLANGNAGDILIDNNVITNCGTAFHIYAWIGAGTFAGKVDITNNDITNVATIASIGSAEYVDGKGVPFPFDEGAYVNIENNKISQHYVAGARILSHFWGCDGIVNFTNNDLSEGTAGIYDSWTNVLATPGTFALAGNKDAKVMIDGVLYKASEDCQSLVVAE